MTTRITIYPWESEQYCEVLTHHKEEASGRLITQTTHKYVRAETPFNPEKFTLAPISAERTEPGLPLTLELYHGNLLWLRQHYTKSFYVT